MNCSLCHGFPRVTQKQSTVLSVACSFINLRILLFEFESVNLFKYLLL